MFWGSIRQTVTELGTASAQITSQSIANIINKTLFKGTNRYDNKDLAWAAKLAMKPLGRQIITDLGMYNTNLGEFTDSEYVETQKKLAYQTKWGFWTIRTTLRQAVQSVVFAQMHKEGIVEKVPVRDFVSAISTGIVRGNVLLDLDYKEDSTADVDMNFVMTGSGRFIEVQGTAEQTPFDRDQFNEMADVATKGISGLTKKQVEIFGDIN